MCFGPPLNGSTSRCHLLFEYPEHIDPHLEQFKALDEVDWIHIVAPIRDASS
jgi:hypothetical protein